MGTIIQKELKKSLVFFIEKENERMLLCFGEYSLDNFDGWCDQSELQWCSVCGISLMIFSKSSCLRGRVI